MVYHYSDKPTASASWSWHPDIKDNVRDVEDNLRYDTVVAIEIYDRVSGETLLLCGTIADKDRRGRTTPRTYFMKGKSPIGQAMNLFKVDEDA